MHNRRARWLVPFLTASLLVSASAASTAFAHGKGGGKKARGEVTSFDSTSMALVVAMRNGDTFEGTVDPDAQVKMEHRGNHSHGQGHGNPSRGSLEDILPGALVLRMKFDDEGVVDKIRLRKAAVDPCEPAVEEPTVEEPEGEDPEGEEPTDDGSEEGDGTTTERRLDDGDDVTECAESEPGDDVEGEEEPGDDSGDDVEDESDDGSDDSDDGTDDSTEDEEEDTGDDSGSEGGV
jgi:hypothetical protein